MELKGKITLEEVNGKAFKIRMFEASEHGNATLTHYLQNHKNGVSSFYKKEALNHIKKALEHKFPEDNITSKAAEEALKAKAEAEPEKKESKAAPAGEAKTPQTPKGGNKKKNKKKK